MEEDPTRRSALVAFARHNAALRFHIQAFAQKILGALCANHADNPVESRLDSFHGGHARSDGLIP